MSGRKQKPYTIPEARIESAASEGKSLLRHDGKVIFIPFAAPGDVADIEVYRHKKNYADARITRLISPSPERVTPACVHYGTCGGCKWQHLSYSAQLAMKQEQVANDLKRIGKVEVAEFMPILGSKKEYRYRNKVEFTFSNKAWEEHFDKNNPGRIPALGFHIPGMFDKVLNLENCHIAPEGTDAIRNSIMQYALDNGYSFFDLRQQTGFLRNLMLRCNSEGKWMLVLIVAENKPRLIADMFDALMPLHPEIEEWTYAVNLKKNDMWSDLQVHTVKGRGYLSEQFEHLKFKIRPQSFFQTNTEQALELYRITRDFANLSGRENVYDLYTGTGSIALFVASGAAHVTGIEYVEAAVQDARENAQMNGVENASFYAGDMKEILNDELIAQHGKPDVVITDPPRDGMHPGVVEKLNELLPERIVYVSCNSSTQARDIAMLSEHYSVQKVKPVDMFPHTHHVESVALLIRKPEFNP